MLAIFSCLKHWLVSHSKYTPITTISFTSRPVRPFRNANAAGPMSYLGSTLLLYTDLELRKSPQRPCHDETKTSYTTPWTIDCNRGYISWQRFYQHITAAIQGKSPGKDPEAWKSPLILVSLHPLQSLTTNPGATTIRPYETWLKDLTPLKSSTAHDVAQAFLVHVLARHGTPRAVTFDRGPQFVGLF
ncbi:hypothetical protein CFIMG_007664RA00001c [Ceratocystis fimbriata CBS 114723]|uniref:Integrase catalytic domain-containing protein n=1 Tax=Ceratocystis fimbriata CBS 114723 TaxID=1035309 RepID=A0A2C5WU25_9PEZI|nr:hypothetical protein CFIMG_007664RA00001c [Ceratocystis fimbriata CBS 114723]